MESKPSFFSSVMSGIGGWFKGLFAGGFVGVLAGAVVAGGIAAITGGIGAGAISAIDWGAVGATALSGAAIGGAALGALGATAGAVAGVVKSRETPQIPPEALVALGQGAALQGVGIGMQLERENGTKWRDAQRVRAQARAAITTGE